MGCDVCPQAWNQDGDMTARLEEKGIRNPRRVRRLIHGAVDFLRLDLSGFIVLTEAASRYFVVTPVIAALGGARKVYAVTDDSVHGSKIDVAEVTRAFAEFCGVKNRIEVLFEKEEKVVRQADIVTNLGFVRPVDHRMVEMMHDRAVVSLMHDAWEVRPGDVALDHCRQKGIAVVATHEEYPGLRIFDLCGNLCMKMLFELDIEVCQSRACIVSGDKFGRFIERSLRAAGAVTARFATLADGGSRDFLRDADVLIAADYTSPETLIGKEGALDAETLAALSPGISVLQFCGIVDTEGLRKAGIPFFPQHPVGRFRMGMTLGELGPRPVVDLHCAGLKAGEIAAGMRRAGLTVEEMKEKMEKTPGLAEFVA